MVAVTYTPQEDAYFLYHAKDLTKRKWDKILENIARMSPEERIFTLGRDKEHSKSAIRNRVHRMISGQQDVSIGKCKNKCKLCGQFARGHTCRFKFQPVQYRQVHIRMTFANPDQSLIRELKDTFIYNTVHDDDSDSEPTTDINEQEDTFGEETDEQTAGLFFAWLNQEEDIQLDSNPTTTEPNLEELRDYIMTSAQYTEINPDMDLDEEI
jgi:hypothetical protein